MSCECDYPTLCYLYKFAAVSWAVTVIRESIFHSRTRVGAQLRHCSNWLSDDITLEFSVPHQPNLMDDISHGTSHFNVIFLYLR